MELMDIIALDFFVLDDSTVVVDSDRTDRADTCILGIPRVLDLLVFVSLCFCTGREADHLC